MNSFSLKVIISKPLTLPAASLSMMNVRSSGEKVKAATFVEKDFEGQKKKSTKMLTFEDAAFVYRCLRALILFSIMAYKEIKLHFVLKVN